jgi:hypothetical protein
VQPARRADNSDVFVVPNVKVRIEAQHSAPPPPAESPWLVSENLYLYCSESNHVSSWWRNQQMHLWLFIDHTCMFRSPSATILRVYSIKEYNKKLCVTNQSKICLYKTSLNSKILHVIMIKWLKVVFVGRRICCCIGRSVQSREAGLGLLCTERPIKQQILRPTNTTFNHFIMITSRILVQDLSS